MTDETTAPEGRTKTGQFVKGVSGNPAGRPKGTRNHIVMLRENTELALRDYLSSPASQKRAIAAIDRVFRIAESGEDREALQAMKMLFDKILPNAKGGGEEEQGKQKPIAIQIINQTDKSAGSPVRVIEGEFETV